MIVMHDVGIGEVGELAGLVMVGRELVFELNINSLHRYIQLQVADITYLLTVLNLKKKHLPKKVEP